MKLSTLLIFIFCTLLGKAQLQNDLIQGEWILQEIKDIPNYNSHTTFPKVDVSTDPILTLKFDSISLEINRSGKFYSETSQFNYEIIKDSSKVTMPTSKEEYIFTKDFLLLSDNSNNKKRNKQKPKNKIKVEIIKITNSQLILEYFHSYYESPFLQHTTRRYYYSKIIEDTNSITENNFGGDWFICNYIEGNNKFPDTLTLQRDSCVVIRKGTDQFPSNKTHIQKITFDIDKDESNYYYFSSTCLNCILQSHVLFTLKWFIRPNKSEITLSDNFHYQFEKNRLILIKNK